MSHSTWFGLGFLTGWVAGHRAHTSVRAIGFDVLHIQGLVPKCYENAGFEYLLVGCADQMATCYCYLNSFSTRTMVFRTSLRRREIPFSVS
jgi:hypothetical protein